MREPLPTPDYYLGLGDTAPVLSTILRDGAGNPVDLTGATVTMKIGRFDQGAPARTVDVDLVDQTVTLGGVTYDWVDADSAVAGYFTLRFKVVVGGKKMSFRNDTNHRILLVSADP